MRFLDALLPEFDREIATTRRLLERLPEDRFGWKPHGRSMSLGELAQHVAAIPTWGTAALTQAELDLAAAPAPPPPPATRGEVLRAFDTNAAAARAALVGMTDALLTSPWTLKRGRQTIFTMPRAGVWRSFVMNHLVHHRGQLSVYLRLADVPLPSIYGPSADEPSV
jgi:uncharacterized damage-inducible protein DinB